MNDDNEKMLQLLQNIRDNQLKFAELFNSYLEKYTKNTSDAHKIQKEYINRGKQYEESQKAYQESLKKSEFIAKIRLILLAIVAVGIILNLFLN